jgi:hypothetical protein
VGHHLEAAIAHVHPAREVAEVAGDLGLVAEERGHLAVPLPNHGHHGVAELVLEGEDVVAELRAEPRLDLRRWKRAS